MHTNTTKFVTPQMLQILSELRHKCAIGFVGGSNLAKQQEQLGGPVDVTSLFDFCFAENGLTAIRMGEVLASQSFIGWIGEDRYKALVKWYVTYTLCKVSLTYRCRILHYIADLDIPIKSPSSGKPSPTPASHTPSAAKSPSMSSPPAGTRPTA
jgi:phosphomannomutase